MAIFAQDAFDGTNGTDITSRVDDLGNSWTEHASDNASAWVILSNRAQSSSGTGQTVTAYNSGTPATAEYDVQADNYWQSSFGSAAHSLVARIDTGAHTWYEAGHTVTGTDRYFIAKRVAGVYTEIGTNTPQASGTAGTTDTWLLEIRDGTKRLLVGGVEKASTTDNTITAAGRVGIRGSHTSSSAGSRFDNFVATDAGGGGATTYNQAVAGALTAAGAAAKVTRRTINAGVASAGLALQRVARALSGAVTPAATAIQQARLTFAGAVTSAGAVSRRVELALVGAAGSVGAVQRGVRTALTGVAASTGNVARLGRRLLAGAVASAGDLSSRAVVLIQLALTGAIAAAGTVARGARVTRDGAVGSVGIVARSGRLALVGMVATGGSLARRLGRLLGGTVSALGALASGVPAEIVPTRTLTAPTRPLTLTAATRPLALTAPTRPLTLTARTP